LLSFLLCFCVFFFFQAEDGIRDFHVTGVQTCALPISAAWSPVAPRRARARRASPGTERRTWGNLTERTGAYAAGRIDAMPSCGRAITCTDSTSPTLLAATAPASVAAFTAPTSPRTMTATSPPPT